MSFRSLARLVLAAVLFALSAAHARAQGAAPALADSLRYDPTVRRGVLPNGIRWFIKHNGRPEARVSLRLAVPVGSTAEADDQQGLAHFTEHMNFNGSAHFKDADDLVGYLRSIGRRFGADANAYTSFDETVYMLDVPTDGDSLLHIGLDALSDFAGRATMSDVEIDKERGVVMEEWRLGRGAQERLLRKQFPLLFHDSRYALRLPIGKPEIIQGAPHDRLRAFYRDWYRPEWLAVIAVGDVDPDRMQKLIEQHFTDLPKRSDSREVPRYDVPPHDSTFVGSFTDREATFSSVSVACGRTRNAETAVRDERADLEVELFSSLLNARFDEISHRTNTPFLNAFGSGFQFTRAYSLYFVSATVADGGVAKGLESVLEETARVRTHGFLASELDRAKRDKLAELDKAFAERDKTESPGLAAGMVQSYLNGEPSLGIEASTRLDRALLPGITLAEVNALADTLVSTRNRTILANGPEKAGAAMPKEADLRAIVAREALAKPAPWVDKSAGQALMARLPTPGKIVSTRAVDEIGSTVLKLSNGVEVWLKPTDFKADEIQFSAYAPGGTSTADSLAFFAAWASAIVVNDNGVGGFKNTELTKLLAGRIVRVQPFEQGYTHGVIGSTRPEDLETALQLIHLTFTKPTEDPDAFGALRNQFITFLANRKNSPEQVFADSAAAVNTGGFLLSRTPTAAEIETVKLPTALDFHRRQFANAANFTFFFAGNFKVDSIAPLVARYLGSLPSTGKPTSAWVPKGPTFPDGVTRVTVRKGVEPKGSVRLTFFTHEKIEELDQHRANSAASILTDHLRSSLRELLGGTYSVGARFQHQLPLSGYSTMSVSFGCDPARADTLIAVTLDEIRKLETNGPSPEDVSKEQEVQRRELETSLKQNGFWTASMQTMHLLGWDPRRIAKRRERIDLLTRDNLHDTFRKYFPMDHYSVIRLEPELGAKATP